MEYNSYQTSQSQNQGYSSQSTGYSTRGASYGPDLVITSPKKGRCPTGGRCVVCSRLCMVE